MLGKALEGNRGVATKANPHPTQALEGNRGITKVDLRRNNVTVSSMGGEGLPLRVHLDMVVCAWVALTSPS